MEYMQLNWMDYLLLAVMFGFSLLVGIYFGCFGKQNTTKDYLQGGRQMKVFPVAMSLVASTLSGISLLGIPTEVYMYGTQYWMMVLALVFAGSIIYFTFLPVFCKLQLTSIFEYLEIRYDKNIRTMFSVLYTFTSLTILPVVIYAPSLAFNLAVNFLVTGFNIYLIATIMSIICIFYTTIGGIKAVIWADTLQFGVTSCTLALVLIKGIISAGGPSTIWEKAERGGRIEFFNMDLDPTLRNTFWSVVLGNVASWTYLLGSNQATMQRFTVVPTYSDSKKILLIYVILTSIIKSIGCFSGLIIYAKYDSCDPFTSGYIKKPDQILPFFVADIVMDIPGLSGLFICGLFTTALSTLSTYLNAVSATIYSDVVCLFMAERPSERASKVILKIVTIMMGTVALGLVFILEKLGTIIQIVISLSGVNGGALLGIYIMGMIFPLVNRKGALYGTITSLLIMTVLVVGNQIVVWEGLDKNTPKPLQTYGCNASTLELWNVSAAKFVLNNLTSQLNNNTNADDKTPFWLFTITFHYYILIGAIITIVVGLIVSWTGRENDELPVHQDLLCPFAQKLFKKSFIHNKYISCEIEMTNRHNRADGNVSNLL